MHYLGTTPIWEIKPENYKLQNNAKIKGIVILLGEKWNHKEHKQCSKDISKATDAAWIRQGRQCRETPFLPSLRLR